MVLLPGFRHFITHFCRTTPPMAFLLTHFYTPISGPSSLSSIPKPFSPVLPKSLIKSHSTGKGHSPRQFLLFSRELYWVCPFSHSSFFFVQRIHLFWLQMSAWRIRMPGLSVNKLRIQAQLLPSWRPWGVPQLRLGLCVYRVLVLWISLGVYFALPGKRRGRIWARIHGDPPAMS